MKNTQAKFMASASLIVVLTLTSPPLAAAAAPEVVAWGADGSGQTDVPRGLSNVVAIAPSLALTAEGRVVAWGTYWNGSTYVSMAVPSGLSNVILSLI